MDMDVREVLCVHHNFPNAGKCTPAKQTDVFEFGTITLGDDQAAFYADVNRQIPGLCRSLPSSMQTEALLAFMRYCGLAPGDKLDFFRRYPVPAWSIVYWISRPAGNMTNPIGHMIKLANRAHVMAMCLHSLDDHLVDGEIPTDHLVLLLRSQAWALMNKALEGLAEDLPGGQTLVDKYLSIYYDAICNASPVSSLEGYCSLFRKQMATGFIVPALLNLQAKGDPQYASQIEAAFGAFGIAWRLLDDLQDMPSDLANSVHSAVYLCSSDAMKTVWDIPRSGNPSDDDDLTEQVLACLREEKVCERLCGRIGQELETAAGITQSCGLYGLSQEFRYLGRPFGVDQEAVQ
jgi:hypothetical protein